jgi:uncharacterized protein (DUF1330 family)
MSIHPISSAALVSISSTRDPALPICMLNLWRIRAFAIYPPSSPHSPCTGVEATDRYRAAIGPCLPEGAAIKFMGNPLGMAAGPEDERWDRVIVVWYPSLNAFRDMVESERYLREAQPHRVAALEEWRLVVLEEVEGK